MVSKGLSIIIVAFLVAANPIAAVELTRYAGSDAVSVDERSGDDESVDAVTSATWQEDGRRSGWGPRLHRIAGYATMAGALVTGITGWNDSGSLHETAAFATTGLALATTGIGAVAYARDRSIPLGHVILGGLGTLGFAANLFIEPEDGTGDIHRWLGTGATAAFALSVAWVIVY